MAGYLKLTLSLTLASAKKDEIAKAALLNMFDNGFDCMRQFFDRS